jgi:hypothetical protein
MKVRQVILRVFQMKMSAQLPALDGSFPGKDPWLQIVLESGRVHERLQAAMNKLLLTDAQLITRKCTDRVTSV